MTGVGVDTLQGDAFFNSTYITEMNCDGGILLNLNVEDEGNMLAAFDFISSNGEGLDNDNYMVTDEEEAEILQALERTTEYGFMEFDEKRGLNQEATCRSGLTRAAFSAGDLEAMSMFNLDPPSGFQEVPDVAEGNGQQFKLCSEAQVPVCSGFFRDCWPLPSDDKACDFVPFPEPAPSESSVQLMKGNSVQQTDSEPAVLQTQQQAPACVQPPVIQLRSTTPPESTQPSLMPMPAGQSSSAEEEVGGAGAGTRKHPGSRRRQQQAAVAQRMSDHNQKTRMAPPSCYVMQYVDQYGNSITPCPGGYMQPPNSCTSLGAQSRMDSQSMRPPGPPMQAPMSPMHPGAYSSMYMMPAHRHMLLQPGQLAKPHQMVGGRPIQRTHLRALAPAPTPGNNGISTAATQRQAGNSSSSASNNGSNSNITNSHTSSPQPKQESNSKASRSSVRSFQPDSNARDLSWTPIQPSLVSCAMSGMKNNNMEPGIKDPNIFVGKYTLGERRNRILRYRAKRTGRAGNQKTKYACRKNVADSRPRVHGRFMKGSDSGGSQDYEGEDVYDDGLSGINKLNWSQHKGNASDVQHPRSNTMPSLYAFVPSATHAL